MQKIKNFKKLALSDLRVKALKIAEAGLEAIDTDSAVKNNISLRNGILSVKKERVPLKNIKRIFIVGIGKCAFDASLALSKILGERLNGGIIITPQRNQKLKIENLKLKIIVGTHPLPSLKNVKATREIIKLLSGLNKNDLVIFVVSGGGSTLLCQPPKPADFNKEIALVKKLFKAGATIREINTIRKHVSLARGGFLAKYAFPARSVSLIFSDVPGDDLQFVASGPAVMDKTRIRDAERIIRKYKLTLGLKLIETPKDKKYFKKTKNILFVSNKTALEAMGQKAGKLGFASRIVSSNFSGEASILGRKVVKKLYESKRKTVLLYGGESTVTIKGKGKGGRNEELALSALKNIGKNQLVLALASDGRDNTDFAGALCDIMTNVKAARLNLNPQKYLKENNSYKFFALTGDYVLTGPTGSNVSDLIISING